MPPCRNEARHTHGSKLAVSGLRHVVELQIYICSNKLEWFEGVETYSAPPFIQDGLPYLPLAQFERSNCGRHELDEHLLVRQCDPSHHIDVLRQQVNGKLHRKYNQSL